jgi:hypothetical protein
MIENDDFEESKRILALYKHNFEDLKKKGKIEHA